MNLKKETYNIWIPLLYVLVALIPVMVLRDFSPANELRYLSIADEAIQNGTYFTFTNHGIPYADKPPLYLWIVMFGKWLFGSHCMWFLSLFSLIPAFVIVLVMDRWARHEIQPQFRVDSMLLTLTCGLFTGMAVFLRMDMLMTMWITLALYTFYNMQHGIGCRTRQKVLFPIYIFLAVFTKGPMGILIPLVTTTAFLWEKKELRQWGRSWGWTTWGILLLFCGAWFLAVWAEGGKDYLDNLLFHQTVNRAVNSFHHKRPFWYYLVSMWYTFMPWAFLLIGAVVAGFIRKTRVRNDIDFFFLTAAVTTLMMLSFISSKIQVYLLPAYPFFCYLGAIYMSRYPQSGWVKAAIAIPAVIICVAGVSLKMISDMEELSYLGHPLFITAGIILSATAALSLWFLFKRKKTNLAVRAMACGLLGAIFVGGLAVPSINDRAGYRIISEKAAEISDTSAKPIFTYAMRRPENMDVFLGSRNFTIVEKNDTIGVDTLTNAVVIVADNAVDRFKNDKKTRIGADWIVVIDRQDSAPDKQ